ncbi:MAG TPA: DUF5666 domain-containing protein, partial [Phototrophicaceae bacterium]|nr:DUF5666 domain-containing protein [Phototrophicaceae bacterium]
SGTTITIGGQTIDISQAEFYTAFAIGDVVKVKITRLESGAVIALEVERPDGSGDNTNDNTADNSNDNTDDNANDNADDNSNDNTVNFDDQEFKLTGTITEVGDGYIILSGIRVVTTGANISGDLTVGGVVEVKLSVVDDQFAALKIEPASPGEDHALSAECVVTAPEGWTTYAIQFGDTLSGVAVGSDAALSELVATNCINNASAIPVGTILFVPHEPAPLASDDNGNNNDNSDDNGNSNDNSDDHSNDNGSDDHSNDNSDDHNNDNGSDDHSNDNGDDHSNDNHDDQSDDSHDDSNDNS